MQTSNCEDSHSKMSLRTFINTNKYKFDLSFQNIYLCFCKECADIVTQIMWQTKQKWSCYILHKSCKRKIVSFKYRWHLLCSWEVSRLKLVKLRHYYFVWFVLGLILICNNFLGNKMLFLRWNFQSFFL